jgi:hypothetical protein
MRHINIPATPAQPPTLTAGGRLTKLSEKYLPIAENAAVEQSQKPVSHATERADRR